MKLFCWDLAKDKGAGFVRLGLWGPGFHFTTRPPLFSERYGYRKPFLVIGKYRFFVLRRVKC